MAIGNVTKDNESNFTIAVGKQFTDILDKFDAVGEIKKDIEYRKSHGLPLIYDVYTRKEDGSWKIKKSKNKQMKFGEVNMIDIKLNDGQSGYDVIGEYIRRYWEHNIHTTVIVSIGTSYNGQEYSLLKEVASPIVFDDIEYLYDWWEGEKYIKLFGIQSVDELDISGGIYE